MTRVVAVLDTPNNQTMLRRVRHSSTRAKHSDTPQGLPTVLYGLSAANTSLNVPFTDNASPGWAGGIRSPTQAPQQSRERNHSRRPTTNATRPAQPSHVAN